MSQLPNHGEGVWACREGSIFRFSGIGESHDADDGQIFESWGVNGETHSLFDVEEPRNVVSTLTDPRCVVTNNLSCEYSPDLEWKRSTSVLFEALSTEIVR